jgi:hypothetical protein
VIELDDGIVGPELGLDIFPRHQFAGMLEQHHQNLKRLFRKPYPQAVFAQFPGAHIKFEAAEMGEARQSAESFCEASGSQPIEFIEYTLRKRK